MKNLLIFVDPAKDFNAEHRALVKIQIDWSLEVGWEPGDIMLVTNFPYEYHGVKAVEVEDDCYYAEFSRATKVPVINRLFEKGFITDYMWFHDFDAFQLEPLDIKSDFAITQYGKNEKGSPENKWNAGSVFFKDAHHIFKLIERVMRSHGIDEENALTHLLDYGFNNSGIYKCEFLNTSYNTHIYSPIDRVKVAHFHPHKPHHRKLFNNVLPEKLKQILDEHIK
jgi:hypothetical protein